MGLCKYLIGLLRVGGCAEVDLFYRLAFAAVLLCFVFLMTATLRKYRDSGNEPNRTGDATNLVFIYSLVTLAAASIGFLLCCVEAIHGAILMCYYHTLDGASPKASAMMGGLSLLLLKLLTGMLLWLAGWVQLAVVGWLVLRRRGPRMDAAGPHLSS
ncbi:MAG: hypothetical protein A3K19_34055 [Lentisphaerae bacterium RIFOXYB12_FULL_65_16]|nr:MAG: hypothetical protein A3K19_34055 [Lentisphaerae bacterium RIFOXYB12_FULL_65_16]